MEYNDLSSIDLAELFGTSEFDIIQHCSEVIDNTDFRYKRITAHERDNLILQVLKKIYRSDLSAAGIHRHSVWENGWRENLDEFILSGFSLQKLIPKYYKPNVPARLNDEYIMPTTPNFVYEYANVFRTWLFKKYLSSVDSIYEFGCGPAYHLAYLAQLFPEKKLFGLDWASPSQEIIKEISKHYGWDIIGYKFDFLSPDKHIKLNNNSGVFTFGALEQIGANHGKFLEYLLENNPTICINVECINEFYDQENLLSCLALMYHEKRSYLSGYFSALKKLESENRIEILASHHHRFGNIFDDSFSYVIWKPKVK